MKTATPKPDGGKYVVWYHYSVKIVERISYSAKLLEAMFLVRTSDLCCANLL